MDLEWLLGNQQSTSNDEYVGKGPPGMENQLGYLVGQQSTRDPSEKEQNHQQDQGTRTKGQSLKPVWSKYNC